MYVDVFSLIGFALQCREVNRQSLNRYFLVIHLATLATVAFIVYRLVYRDVVFAAFVSLILTGVSLYYSRKEGSIGRNLVYVVDGEYVDMGDGLVLDGLAILFLRNLEYDPRPRLESGFIALPTRAGDLLGADYHLIWRPDPTDLKHWFEDGPERLLKARLQSHLEAWSKTRTPDEIYAQTPTPLVVPGIKTDSLDVVGVDDAKGMSRHIRDNSRLVESIVSEIEDIAAIEKKQEELIKRFPESKLRIDMLCGDRKKLLMDRGLRENR